MTENNAAQPGLTDAEILHRWDIYVSEPCASYPLTASDKIDFARAIESALLSKLRAEGVQAGDDVQLPAPDATIETIPYWDAGHMKMYARNAVRAALASAPVAGEPGVWKTGDDDLDMALNMAGVPGDAALAQVEAVERLKERLASAPVVGEAQKPFAWVQEVPGYEPRVFLASRIKDPTQGDGWKPEVKWRALVLADAAPQASEAVRQILADSYREELDKLSKRNFELRMENAALKAQADKDGGDCAKGAGDVAQRLRDNAELDAAEGGNPQVIALELEAAAEIDRLRAALSPTQPSKDGGGEHG